MSVLTGTSSEPASVMSTTGSAVSVVADGLGQAMNTRQELSNTKSVGRM